MENDERRDTNPDEVEGEGSYQATHRYNEAVSRHAKEGDTERLAKEAAEALDGPEGEDLRRAEEEAKKGPGGKSPSGVPRQP